MKVRALLATLIVVLGAASADAGPVRRIVENIQARKANKPALLFVPKVTATQPKTVTPTGSVTSSGCASGVCGFPRVVIPVK